VTSDPPAAADPSAAAGSTAPSATAAPPAPQAPLAPLTGALRNEVSLTRVVGVPDATLAVAGPAQAFTVAGLARLSDRRPILVVTATESDADRFAADLACFVTAPEGADDADLKVAGDVTAPVLRLPAWETLPFERVSPDVATMGQRLAVMWQLAGDPEDGARRPAIVVASVRALLQRLAPWREIGAPLVVRRGARLDVGEATSWLAAAGYRREPQVEHRGEFAVFRIERGRACRPGVRCQAWPVADSCCSAVAGVAVAVLLRRRRNDAVVGCGEPRGDGPCDP